MTPAPALREHAERLEREAAALRELADTLGTAEPHVAEPTPAAVTIGVSVAAKIMRVSDATAYRHGRRFGLAWQTPSGAWAFDRDKVRAFAAARRDGFEAPLKDLKHTDLFHDDADARMVKDKETDNDVDQNCFV